MKEIDKIAFIYLKDGKILSTLSKGKDTYYIPGGKREGNETDEETLIRECKEELDIDIKKDTIKYYGTFEAQAHGKAEGIEYRNPGIMESQIFTVLKVRLGSGRKSFSELGASYLSKVCALKVEEKNEISLEKIEEPIKIDNSVEEWMNAIEKEIKNNKQHRANRKETESNSGARKNVLINARFMKEIMKEKSFSQMGYII